MTAFFHKIYFTIFLISLITLNSFATLPGDLNENGIRDAGDLNIIADIIQQVNQGNSIDDSLLEIADVFPADNPDKNINADDYEELINLIFYDLIQGPPIEEPTPTPTMTITPTIPSSGPTATPTPLPERITIPIDQLSPSAIPLELQLIENGTFLMGGSNDDPALSLDEQPQREIVITDDFYIGKYLVTLAQWQAIMGNAPSVYTYDENLPVDSITWFEALEFLQNLSSYHSGTFRLPTETEWEYACRAGTTTRYYWGDDLNHTDFTNFTWNYFNSDQIPHPVAQKEPNPWGLYDMSGNMQEWCLDWYDTYDPNEIIDPSGPSLGEKRILRGGFWGGSHEGVRSAARNSEAPNVRSNTISFRVVMEPPSKPVIPVPTPATEKDTITFGVNLQSFSANSIDVESVRKAKEDNLNLIRYFAQESIADNIGIILQAIENEMQIIMTYSVGLLETGIDCSLTPCIPGQPITDCCQDCWWNLDLISFDEDTGEFTRRYNCSPEGYAQWINFRLNQIDQAIPGALGNVVIGIQIGNEEEAKWPYDIDNSFYAGQDYAEYYLAAEEVLTANWPQLKLFGGSIESHRALDFDVGGPSSEWLEDNGRSARGFLNGFIQKVLELNDNQVDRLPDYIAINGYPGKAPPEYIHEGRGTKEWINRLDTLDAICNFYNYFPRYANMENGFSVLESSPYGVIGANEMTQALYYLRYSLMNGTMKTENDTIWDYTAYWVYSYNGDTKFDTGWFRNPNQDIASTRPIRKVAQILHSNHLENALGLGTGFKIWIPAFSERGDEELLIYNNKMTCGWIDQNNQKWVAMWRYKNNVDYHYTTESRNEDLIVPEDTPQKAHLYKIIFDEPYDYENTAIVQITETPLEGFLNNDHVIFNIPAVIQHSQLGSVPVVNENPVFIKFVEE